MCAVIVGQLQVNVTTGTATLTFDDAKKKLDDFGNSAQGASQKLDYSMREARESIMLTGEALGVHLPAGITRVIASLGPLGEALVTALPAVAIIAALGIITKIVGEFEKLGTAGIKASNDIADFTVKETDATKSMELANLKLEDQITKLEGGVPHNQLKEALLQASIAADTLAQRIGAATKEADNDIIDMSTIVSQLWETLKTPPDMSAIKNLFKIVGDLASGNVGAASMDAILSTKTGATIAALGGVTKAIQQVEDAKLKMAQAAPGSEAEKAAQQELIDAYKTEGQAAEEANKTIGNSTQAQIKEHKELQEEIISSASAVKQFALEEQNAALQGKEANDERQQAVVAAHEAVLKAIAQGVSAHAAAMRQIAQLHAEESTSEKGNINAQLAAIDDAKNQEIAAAKETLDSKVAIYKEEVKLYAVGTERRKELDAEYNNAVEAYLDAQDVAVARANEQKIRQSEQVAQQIAQEDKEHAQQMAQEEISAESQALSGKLAIINANLDQARSATQSAVNLGLISRKQGLELELGYIQDERKAKITALQQEVAIKKQAVQEEIEADAQAANKVYASNGGRSEDPEYKKYLDDMIVKRQQLIALDNQEKDAEQVASTQANTNLQKTKAALDALYPSWKNLASSGVTFANQLSNSIKPLNKEVADLAMNFTNQLNSAIAQSIVEGKNFGEAMHKAFVSAAEGVIEYILELLELKAIQLALKALGLDSGQDDQAAKNKALQTSFAQLAGARAAATTDYPLDLIIPEIVFGAAMVGMAEGGIVPGSGSGDTVPAMLSPGEAVLPKAMTERLSNASSSSGTHQHYHLNQTNHIKAWDSSDIKEAMMSNRHEFIKAARSESRRSGKR